MTDGGPPFDADTIQRLWTLWCGSFATRRAYNELFLALVDAWRRGAVDARWRADHQQPKETSDHAQP